MQRWLTYVLVPLAIFSISTMLVTTKIMSPDENSNLWSQLQLDYMAGSGAPPLPTPGDYGMKLDEDPGMGDEDGDEPPDLEMLSDEEEEEENDDDDDNDPRPRKHPKGKKWKGWDKTQPILPRNVGNNPWWRKSRLCFEVDHICHGQEKNDWFYYTPSQQHPSTLFQPTMELKSAPAKYDGGKDRGETRISINVASSPKIKQEEVDKRCHISPTPTHVVLQSLFNDMIGEFYSRTLLRLYHFMTDGVDENDKKGTKLPWEEDIQFYVHIPYGNKKMLDGHKLLLSGMLSNPDSPAAKSLLDLFVKDWAAAKDNSSSSGSNDCQCYEKMVFCGYDVYTHASDVKSKDLEPAAEDDDDHADTKQSLQQSLQLGDVANDDDNAASPTSNDDLKYTLWSAGKLGGHDFDTGNCGRGTGTRGTEYLCQEWNGLRNFLSANFVKHYPTLEREIVNRRRDQLLTKGVIDKSYKGNTKEFTVIGLTQRTYRRAWLNLPAILKECDAASFERAICVEVNVENTATPFEQLLLHRSLDVMIGVHGAQLTQGILLPEHAHVLEVLPWVPDYIRGKWVQTTKGPTPLGVIFHNTNLNHVGYSLDRSSVPLCKGVNEEEEQNCFMRQRKKFIWENRDFNVESEAVLHYIEKFVLFGRDKERACDELKKEMPKKFVLYNIWCSKPRYWFPGFSDGEKACVYGSGYPIDHTDEHIKGMYLFDSKDACCVAYTAACQAETESDKKEQENSSENGVSLFHSYHKPSSEEETERVALLHGRNKKKGKRKKRKKQEER